jgi:hypothetical protein
MTTLSKLADKIDDILNVIKNLSSSKISLAEAEKTDIIYAYRLDRTNFPSLVERWKHILSTVLGEDTRNEHGRLQHVLAGRHGISAFMSALGRVLDDNAKVFGPHAALIDDYLTVVEKELDYYM